MLAEWVVGSLAVAYEESDDRILLVAEELVVQPDDDADERRARRPVRRPIEPATARFHLTRDQVVGVHPAHAASWWPSGRPTCPLCGRPIDPDGHACPTAQLSDVACP